MNDTINSYIALGDCLELMKDIPDKSVNMVLCDLPYGILDYGWDKIIDGKKLFAEYKRICRQKANVLLFCQMSFAHYLMNCALDREFSHCLIWCKKNATRFKSGKHLPKSKYEMVLVFRINKDNNKEKHGSLRDYMMHELNASGLDIKTLEGLIPNRSAHHYFRYSSDFRIPTAQNYKRLQEITGRFNRPYEEVQAEFMREKDNLVVYNGENDDDLLYFDLSEKRVHPTQKPVALLEYLIKNYSNPNDVILDNCMGSGSTCVAAINTGRRYIGIEKDPNYYELAQLRINELTSQMSLFD